MKHRKTTDPILGVGLILALAVLGHEPTVGPGAPRAMPLMGGSQPRISESPTPTQTPTTTSIPQMSLDRDVQPIFSLYCVGCHGTNGGLTLSRGESYGELVRIEEEATPACDGQFRVEPSRPNESVLYLRISSRACGKQMPRLSHALKDSDISKIRAWIDQGALNN